ncbi:hypothetical protein JMJ35_006873 [Cladonia borealis]|uniref:Spindle pole body associated protein n=1 Tax=Cladonia borealis TaxID=184061 RepID=A0AA39QZ26_9LECA|nr:hypothetical protein JMJ35_006873 [Cladonia borealis]
MSEPTSPSPPPRPEQRSQTHLLPSSIFSTPSLSSTLPLPRPTSASGGLYRNSLQRKGRTGSSRRRHTRSVTSVSHSSDGEGSLGDFSMENYTIDLAQLGRKVGGAPMVGGKHADMDGSMGVETQPAVKGRNEDLEEDGSDYFDGDYSIDLGALGDSSSSVVLEERVPQREQIPSEDDGPEDFTLNLEKWMRGTGKWEKKKDIKKSSDDHDPEDDQQKGAHAESEEPVDESVFEPVGTSTPAPVNHAIEDFQEEIRLGAPPLSRLNTEMRQDNTAEEVFDRIAALQTEVESMRMEEENRRLAHQALEQENNEMKVEHKAALEREQSRHEQLKKAHRDTQEALKQENEQLKQNYDDAIEQLQVLAQESSPHSAKADQVDATDGSAATELAKLKAKGEADQIEAETNIKALKSELRSFQDECLALKAEIESIKGAYDLKVKELNSELEARKNEIALDREESIERGNEVASLTATIQQKDKEIYALNGEIKALRMELRHAQDQLAELDAKKNEIALERKESIQRGNEAASLADTIERKEKEIYALNGEVKAMKMELEHAQQQLAETRRIMETVEDENDRLMQQNDRQADEVKDLKATVKDYASKERLTRAYTSSTKETQHDEDPERIDMATHEAALEALSQKHQVTLESLGNTHGKELQILRSALMKASLAMQKREAKLARVHKEEVASLKEEIADLKKSVKAFQSSDTGIENELRSAIRVLSSKLEKAHASLKSARADAAEARQKADDMRDTNAAVNAELEAGFAVAVEAREKEWRRRIALLFRERDKMAKALMLGWGREEVGPKESERGQGYKYKYVTR